MQKFDSVHLLLYAYWRIAVIHVIQNSGAMAGPDYDSSSSDVRVWAFMLLSVGKVQCIQSYIYTPLQRKQSHGSPKETQ